jgi:hypothetical protein
LLAKKSPQITQMMALKGQMGKKSGPLQLKNSSNTWQKELPTQLKASVEQLPGVNMEDVKVNYSSSNPSKIGAAAYAQGSEIHLVPGQEQHLPHEAWHVVQQKKGRVKTTNTISGTPVNKDRDFENEADQMGSKAQGLGQNTSKILQKVSLNLSQTEESSRKTKQTQRQPYP